MLEWPAASDEPSCSGIDYYNVSRDGNWIGMVDGDVLSFVDNNVSYGTYSYTVFAVDLVGHNSGDAVKNIVLVNPGNGGTIHVSGGGGSSSYVCVEDWSCEDWSECSDGEQRRLCEDLRGCGPENNKPETYRECGYGNDYSLDDVLVGVNITEGNDGFFSAITGGVIGVVGSTGGFFVIFILIVVGGFVAIRIRKNKGK